VSPQDSSRCRTCGSTDVGAVYSPDRNDRRCRLRHEDTLGALYALVDVQLRVDDDELRSNVLERSPAPATLFHSAIVSSQNERISVLMHFTVNFRIVVLTITIVHTWR